MDQCKGCSKWFYPRGFSNHLHQTHDEKCRAFLNQLFKNPDAVPVYLDDHSAGIEEGNDGAGDEEDNNSAGGEEDDNGNNEEEEEEEDQLYSRDEDWPEAPVPAQTGMDLDSEMAEAELGDDNQQKEVHEAQRARCAAEEEFRKTPIVMSFPSNAAGAPIMNACHAIPKYQSYQRDLTDMDNPWAPFSSQLDWEVAQWAKLRGPSATAFTELLKINGVS